MAVIDPVLGIKLVYILGITNLVSILLVFFSCRCLSGVKFVIGMMKYDWYKKFYSMHCIYWWIFAISVVLHVILSFLMLGSPF